MNKLFIIYFGEAIYTFLFSIAMYIIIYLLIRSSEK